MTKKAIQSLSEKIESLLSSSPIKVSDVISSPNYENNRHQGVYCIHDGNKFVYIGQTIGGRDGIALRIWDHAKEISELVEVLKVDTETFQTYLVRSLEVKDVRLRSRIELFGIAVLDPEGNKLGKTKIN
jgi:hypothetical protein